MKLKNGYKVINVEGWIENEELLERKNNILNKGRRNRCQNR